MQTEILNNIPIEDLREVNVMDTDVLDTLLNVLGASNQEIAGERFYKFLGVAEENQYDLAKQGDAYTSRLLMALSNIYLYLIEESNWLVNLPKSEAEQERIRVENVCRRMRACAEAADLLQTGEAETYINRFLTKVQKTGYIHRKEKTCQIVLDIMHMDAQYYAYVPILVDIVQIRQREEWMASDLRGQLVTLLQTFISYKTDNLKNLFSADSKHDYEQVTQLIKAIAMQLLLYKEGDDINFAYNRAVLYHYASFVPTSNQQALLKNAYYCLIGATSTYPLEFSWGHLASIGVMASLLSTRREPLRAIHKVFSNEEQTMDVTDSAIRVMPNWVDVSALKKSIPSTISMWNGLQVEIDASPSTKISHTTTDLKQFNHWWKEIEQNLFQVHKRKPNVISKKKKPVVGDNVWIVIDGVIDAKELSFHATIRNDDKFEGDGIISIKGDIVEYDPRSINAPFFLDNGFCDPETRKPYLFEAIVVGYIGSLMHFSMAKLIEDDWKDTSLTNYGTELNAVVTYKSPKGLCIAVSEDGPTMQFEDETGVVLIGDKVRLRVTGVKDVRNHGLQLIGEYISSSDIEVTQQMAIIKLLQDYSKGELYDENEDVEQDEPKQQVEKLDSETIGEMIRLIDRQAYLSNDLVERFLLLCSAGLISRIVNIQDQVEYYKHCREQQITLQDFGKNNSINLEKLRQLDGIPEDMISMFPILHLRRQELHALNALGKPDDKDKILTMLELTDNAELKKLCNLVLAYNFLSEFRMDGEKKAIIDSISQLLNIKLDIQEAKCIGAEDEKTEFKSSLIFVANAEHKVIADPVAQKQVILKEINAFLNTKGGKLYIGVNNLGYAVGVTDDLEWFEQNQGKIANVTDMDTYQQYLTNFIYKTWPDINTLIQISKPDYNGRDVVLVEVSPSSTPLMLDGNYYYRVGTETRVITKEGEKDFLKRRPAQYEALKV